MSEEEEDQDLRRRFVALREKEAQDTPAFAGLWRHAQAQRGRRPPRPLVSWLVVAGGTCALLLLLAGVRPHPTTAPRAPTIAAPSLSAWRPPTDFLLRTPALEVLTTVPVLGAGAFPPVLFPSIERRSPS